MSSALISDGRLNKKKKRSRSKSLVRAKKNKLKRERVLRHTGPSFPERTDFEKHVAIQAGMDDDKAAFYSALRRPLPLAFRIRDEALDAEWNTKLQRQLVPSHLHCVPMAVETHAFQICGMRRHDELNASPDLRRFLSSNTSQGKLVRQEIVSMIPCRLLQIEHHHAVLDMCASPGSKTSQAVDALYRDFEQNAKAKSKDKLPSGFVVANDADASRCYVLANRCFTALQERTASLMITCHNARKFPNVEAPLERQTQVFMTPGPYDRIVCDVPCSGDGTIRKDSKVFKVWHPGYGISLHTLQLQIAMRGVSLLKVGGLMTYSTCSFNPIENEAVVYELLKRYKGCLELVDSRDIMESSQLYWRQGWNTWTVVNDEFTEFPSHKDSFQDELPYKPSMWPNSNNDEDSALRATLSRCIRMMPQDNDTGGFFIALLRKTAPLQPPSWKKLGARKLTPKLVTPTADCHVFRPVKSLKTNNEGSTYERYSRSPSQKGYFELSPSLAQHAFQSIGSAKFNIVSAGRKSSND